MVNPLSNHSVGGKTNYWEVDNQLTNFGVFKELYLADKSKNKQDSSQLMWAVCYFTHPESRLINYSTNERKQVIQSDIVTSVELNWEKLNIYIREYKKLYLTQATRSLEEWKSKLEERGEYIMNTKYPSLDLDDAKKLDALLADTPKLFKQYNDILEQMSEEAAKGINKGGIKESASEQKKL